MTSPQFGEWIGQGPLFGLGTLTAVLIFLGMDRRHKYRTELRSLILGNWDKKRELAKAAEKAAAEKAAKDAKTAAPTSTDGADLNG
jgi:hypothetical protein